MDKFETYRDRIDSYVQGRMDEEERWSFEQIMTEQPALRTEVDLHMSYKHSFQRKDLLDFKSILDQVAAEHAQAAEDSNSITVKKVRPFYWLIAAAVIGILIVSVIVWNQEPKLRYQKYVQIEVPHTPDKFSNSRDEFDKVDSIFFALESQLRGKNIERVELKSLIGFIEKAGNDKTYQERYQEANDLLLAQAYLLYGNPKKTLRILDKHWPSDNTTCAVNYYRAVALLELNRNQDAKRVLEALDCPTVNNIVMELLRIVKNLQE